jgi:hypothetical protein
MIALTEARATTNLPVKDMVFRAGCNKAARLKGSEGDYLCVHESMR